MGSGIERFVNRKIALAFLLIALNMMVISLPAGAGANAKAKAGAAMTGAATEAEAEAKPMTAEETKVGTELVTVAEAKAGTTAAKARAKMAAASVKAATKTEAKPLAVEGTKTEAKPLAVEETKAEVKPLAMEETKAEAKPLAVEETKATAADAKPDAKPDADPGRSGGDPVSAADGGVYERLMSGEKVLKQRSYSAPSRPTVYLAFDDGPSGLTSRVLDILKEERVQASFFVLGEQAESRPDLIRRIVREGHSLGNHTYNHNYNELYGDFRSFWDQIRKTGDILHRIAGMRPDMIRAPGGTYGHFDAFYFYYLDQAGYRVYDWNIDSNDSHRSHVPAGEIIDTVEKGPFPHEVHLLLHDGSGHEESVKALPEIIRFFKQKGYVFAPLDPHVQPVSFRIGGLKQAREYGVERYRATLALVGGRAGAASPLVIHTNGKDVRFDPDQYALKDGRLYVGVRKLIETMGGRVDWDEQRQQAAIYFGDLSIQYHLNDATGTFRRSDHPPVTERAAMDVQNGSIIVPLRDLVEWMGFVVDSFENLPQEKDVVLHYTGQSGMARL